MELFVNKMYIYGQQLEKQKIKWISRLSKYKLNASFENTYTDGKEIQ